MADLTVTSYSPNFALGNVVPAARSALARGRAVIEAEAAGLAALAASLDASFTAAVEALLRVRQRVIVSGIGKSGHIGRKLAATLASTGTPAHFVHAAEAAHGDLGMICAGDVLLVLSNSGTSSELRGLLLHADRLGCMVIAIGSQRHSPVMQAADIHIALPPMREACAAGIAPTTSTTMMLALGDALAISVMAARGISPDRIRLLHPGGAIGNRLKIAGDLMHGPDHLPLVPPDMVMADVIVTMTGKSFGIAGVVEACGQLVGVITDGDLRRHSLHLFSSCARDVMTAAPRTVQPEATLDDLAALFTEHRIMALFVVDAPLTRRPVGLVHIHDINRARGI